MFFFNFLEIVTSICMNKSVSLLLLVVDYSKIFSVDRFREQNRKIKTAVLSRYRYLHITTTIFFLTNIFSVSRLEIT